MTIQQLIEAAEHAARYVPTATAEIITRLVQAQQQSEAQVKQLAAENAALKQSELEFDKMCAADYPDWVSELTETPATDAAIASLRAEGANLCKAFLLHKDLAGLDDDDKVTVREAIDAVLHCAIQLRSQSALSPEAAAISRQFEQVKGGQS